MAKPTRIDDANLRSMSQTQIAWLLGRSPSWIRDRSSIIPRQSDGSYDGQQVIAWFVSEQVGSVTRDQDTTDPKERVALATAKLKELEYLERIGRLVARDWIDQRLSKIAMRLRMMQETAQRDFGPRAWAMLEAAITDIEREAESISQSEPEIVATEGDE